MNKQFKILLSLAWSVLMLIPPLRHSLEMLALLVWPSAQPFLSLSKIHPVFVPLTIFVVIGYALCYFLLKYIVAFNEEWETFLKESEQEQRKGGLPIIITLLSMLLLFATQGFSYSYLIVASLIIFANIEVLAAIRPSPFPSPEPEPAPEPEKEEEDLQIEDSEDATYFYRKYEWLYNEEPFRKTGPIKHFSCSIKIPKEDYEKCRNADHHVKSDTDYVEYANANLSHSTVKDLTEKLRKITKENGYDELGELHLTMAFTLCMPYTYDNDDYGYDYPKFPVEMLTDKKGDCEDFSILCSSLFYNLGYASALVLMDFSDHNGGHAAVGVVPPMPLPYNGYTIRASNGVDYVYCEVTPSDRTTKDTTSVQWWLGMMDWKTAVNITPYPLG